MAMDDEMEKNLGDEILRYLSKHPHASDTAEAIALWWLRRQRYEESVVHVQQVLDKLELRGLVTKTVLVDGTVLYGASQEESGLDI